MEEFKQITEFPNYEVSNFGRIRTPKMVKTPVYDKDGYYQTTFFNNGKRKTMKIHRLVAKEFIPNPLNLPQINHKNGIKTDNYIENLEWCTVKENNKHAINTGLVNNKGELNPAARLTAIEVKQIRELNGRMTQLQIANKFGISESTIWKIMKNRTWKL